MQQLGFHWLKTNRKDNSSVVNYRRICNSFKNTVMNCNEIDPIAEILIIEVYGLIGNQKLMKLKLEQKYIKNINDISRNKNFKEIKKIIIFGQIPALKMKI